MYVNTFIEIQVVMIFANPLLWTKASFDQGSCKVFLFFIFILLCVLIWFFLMILLIC